MKRKAVNQYKKASVSTRSRGRILLMLYDGAIRFLEQAKLAMGQKKYNVKGEKISRAHAIISELNASLDHNVAPDLCENLESLYLFMLDQLTVANRDNSPKELDVVIELLDGLRDSWRQVILGEQQQADVPMQPPSVPSLSELAAKG